MKPVIYLSVWPIVAVSLLLSCVHKESTMLLPELAQAEAVMYEHPDSALMILEQMPTPSPSDRLNHATRCLLLTQAKYKNYLKQPSDSLINIAYDYFMRQDDPQRKAMVLYYKGALDMEFGEAEKATPYYLEAAKEVEKTKDYQLAHLVYGGLGDIYIYRSLRDYAEKAFEESYRYAKLSGNKGYIANSLMSMARVCTTQSDWAGAEKYYKEAIEVVKEEAGETRLLSALLSELAGTYKRASDFSLALEYARESFRLKKGEGPNIYQTFLTLGDIYRLMGKKDSAYYYLNKALPTDNIYTKRSAYQALFYLSKEEKDYINAMEYSEKFRLYADSIQKIDRSSKLIEIQEKYNREKLLNEKNQLKIEKSRIARTALLVLLLLLCVIATLIYIYQRKLIQKERTIQKNEEQIRFYAIKIHENEALISRNKSRMQELILEMEQNKGMQELLDEQQHAISEIQIRNESLRKENETLQESICHYTDSLQKKSKELNMLKVLSDENLRLRDREKFLSNQLLKQTTILNELKVTPKYLDSARWQEVREAINWLYNDYTGRLTQNLPSLTGSDLEICCLIKLHLSIPEMAGILGISSTSVSKRKCRLKEHIMQDLNKPLKENQTLELWLWEF